jgi:hypothetical protein
MEVKKGLVMYDFIEKTCYLIVVNGIKIPGKHFQDQINDNIRQ